jgi:hypothetical protein
MTTSVWAKSELTNDFPEANTLQEVIGQLEAKFQLKGEVICEIQVNGIAISEDDEVRLANTPVNDIESLIICSSEPARLIDQALNSCREFIPHVKEACIKTSEALRGTDAAQAQGRFIETMEGCYWLVDTLRHVRGASRGPGTIANLDQWTKLEEKMAAVVRDVVTAFEGKDYVLVADLLEYELSEAVNGWAGVLSVDSLERTSA